MPVPAMSHLIATSALIMLIFTMQVFYFYVVDNIGEEMIKRKLKEIADYVSDTIANLYFLVNSTNHSNVTLQKTLDLPTEIAESSYRIQVLKNDTDDSAKSVLAFLESKSWLNANSWLSPGLTVKPGSTDQILVNGSMVLAGCERGSGSTYVWLACE